MKYVTFSYDDGVRQDIWLIELFRRYSLNATFNLNSGSLGHTGHIRHDGFDVCFDKIRPDEVKQVYAGFEVAMHGVWHKNFPELPDRELEQEVVCDMKALEQLTGEKVTGGAYPCGAYDARTANTLRTFGVEYCRTIQHTHAFDLPKDFCM